MNQIYRLVWSQVNQAWVAVAENASGHGKSISARKLVAAAAALMGGSLFASSAYAADAANAKVVGGTGSVSQSGTTTIINQSSQRLAIDWTSLSTASNEALVFKQPNASAIALNRITGASPSTLLGSLTANGQVYILNPNGVLFGAGAQVNVGGLVASTLSMNPNDFMNGNSTFTKDPNASGSVVNQGTLTTADGGYIVLLSGTVRNAGTINAPLGTALLAAGDKVTLNINNGSLIGYSIDQGDLNALVENKQLIRADGGSVIMVAKALDKLSTAVINNTGVVEARTVQNQNGHILLLGDMDVGTVNVAGTLDASAPGSGNGGTIETSAAHVKVADGTVVTTAAAQGLTGSWLIDPTDFAVAASGGDMTGATLSTSLDTTSVQLQSTSGATSGSGDININDAVSWNAATTLTLSAQRNININQSITASNASGKVALQYGLNAVNARNTATYNVNAPINLQAGDNFSTKLGSNGVTVQYKVITSLGSAGSTTGTDLQGISSNLSGNYVLGSNIDASATSAWNSGAGFAPIGNDVTAFKGVFDGLGHVISNLTINQSTNYVGLFGITYVGSVIKNVGLVGGSVTGSMLFGGGLVGQNNGTVSNSYSTGSVTGSAGSVWVGGLVGANYGTVSNSYATGSVTGSIIVSGGLVGANYGTVSNSYATGSVTGGAGSVWVGGLVGANYGIVSNSYATGSVTGSAESVWVGGLVGQNNNKITASFWNTASSGISIGVGGGSSSGVTGIDNTAASELATFTNAGWSIGATGGTSTIWRIYEGETGPLLRAFLKAITVTADVTSKTYDGTTSTLSTYTPSITGATLSGSLNYVTSKNAGSYSTASGTLAQTGLYSGQQGYDISYANASLTINKANLTVTANAVTKTYDGTTSTTGTGTVGTLAGAAVGDVVNASGSEAFVDKNAGSNKTVVASGVTIKDASNADVSSNYNIAYVDNTTSTVNKANVTLSTSDVTKTYDGTTSATGTAVATVGTIFTGDSLSGGTFGYVDKNVGVANKTVTATGVTVSDGNSGNNYNVSYANNTTSTINKANVTLSTSDVTKTYDGTTSATGTAVATVGTIFTGDSLSGGTFGYVDKNAGVANKTVTATGVTVSDGNSGNNYNVSYANNTTSTINKANVTVTANAVTKTYDGTTSTTGTGTVGTLAGAAVGDVVNASGSEAFVDKNAGSNKTVVASGVTIKDASNADVSSNYNIAYVDNTTSTVNKANVTLSTSDVTKTYDGTTSATGTAVATVGTIFTGDSLSGGTFGYVDKNAGVANKTVTATGVTVSDGNSGNNYNVSYANNTTSTINKANLTVTANAVTKTYDGTTSTTGTGTVGTLAGAAVGDVVNASGSEAFVDKNAGSNKTVVASGVTIKDASNADVSSNYNIAYVDNTTSTINKANVTVTANAVTKTYDGTTSTTGTGTVGTLAGAAVGDVVNASGSEAFVDKNAGSNKTVVASGVTIKDASNADVSSNYNIAYVDNTTSTINKANVTVTANAVTKTYDGTTSTTGTGTVGTLAGAAVGDVVNASGSEAFVDKNAGSNKTVVASGVTIKDASNADVSSNYNIAYVDNTTSTVNKANVTLSTSDVTKTYDGTTSATGTAVATVGTIFTGDSLSGGTFGYVDKNVGVANKTVTATGVTVSDGNSGNNYNVSYANNTTSTINKANLTVTANAVTKTYDGTTSTTGTGTVGTLAGAAVGDVVNASGSEAFVDKNAGSNKTVVASGVTIKDASNADVSSNYNIAYVDNTTSTINKANVTVTANAITKTYDGTTSTTGTGTVGTLAGAAVGDVVNASGSEAFVDKNAGSNKTVVASGVTIKDASNADVSSNYNIAYVDNTTSTVNKANLTANAVGVNKTYDGMSNATVTYTDNRIAGDSLNFSSTASFADKNAGNGKAVMVSSIILNGADAGNYNLTATTGSTSATITPAALTVAANSSSKFYDGIAYAGNNGSTISGLVNGETVADLLGSLAYSGSSQGAISIGNYTITPGGLRSANYTIGFVDGALTIKALSQASAALGSSTLEQAYNSARQTVADTSNSDGQSTQSGAQKTQTQSEKNGNTTDKASLIASDSSSSNGSTGNITPRLSIVGCGMNVPAEGSCQ